MARKKQSNNWRADNDSDRVPIISAILAAVVSAILFCIMVAMMTGCVADSGFIPLNKAKVADEIDIGDEAGRDIIKEETESTEQAPEQKQGAGVQVSQNIVNDRWSIVIFFLGFVFLREGFSYLRMRLKA